MSLFRTLFQRKTDETPEFQSQLAPDIPFFAIGDVHGSYPELKKAFADFQIEARTHTQDPTIVCLGDYIDRGEQSAEVLRQLYDLNTAFPDHFVCLMGNHEYMCLRFIDNPEDRGERWLRFGGLQTLASFNVGIQRGRTMTNIRDDLVRAMGKGLIEWMHNLPLKWQSGNVVAVHAAADPMLPMDAQVSDTLLWGHPDFARLPRQDGVWIVHGHTIVEDPQVHQGRIAIDTGAYATGRLTTAKITREGITFRMT